MGLKMIGNSALNKYLGAMLQEGDSADVTKESVIMVPELMVPSSSVTRSPLGRIQFTVIGRFIPGTGVTSHTSV